MTFIRDSASRVATRRWTTRMALASAIALPVAEPAASQTANPGGIAPAAESRAAPSAADLVVGPSHAPAATLPRFLDDRRLEAIEHQARPLFEANEQRRAEKLKRKAIEADLKRNAEEVRRAVDTMTSGATQPGAQAGTAGPPTGGTIIDIIGPAQAAAAPAAARPTAVVQQPPAARPLQATIGAALPRLPALTTAAPSSAAAAPASPAARPGPAAGCAAPTVTSRPLPGGRVEIAVAAPCRGGEMATIRYAPYVFLRPLAADGRLTFVLDLFQGVDAETAVVLADGAEHAVTLSASDLDRVSKIAVIWGKPVNLDLHVFEYAAVAGGAGHVWAEAPGTADGARTATSDGRRGRGFLSFTSNGTEPGHQVEVYTLWHHDAVAAASAGRLAGGLVATALDYESRGAIAGGELCGDGALARIPFETIALAPGRPPVRERGVVSAVPCGAPLVEKARFQDEAIADLPLRLD